MLDKLFGENGIFGEKGKKYYQNKFDTKLDNMSANYNKKKQNVKKNYKAVLITSFALTFLLNVIFNAQYGYTLFSMLGMSLVEFPFAIPVGIILHNVYKSITEDVNKKLDKEIKKIDDYNLRIENQMKNQLENTHTEERNETQTNIVQESPYVRVVGVEDYIDPHKLNNTYEPFVDQAMEEERQYRARTRRREE